MKNLTSNPTFTRDRGVDLANLAIVIEELREKVGEARGDARSQLAHKTKVPYSVLRKFQTPGTMPEEWVLEALVAHFYPGQMLGADGSITDYKPGTVQRFVELFQRAEATDESGVLYL